MTKVHITGATGYIGGAIAIELQKRGFYVTGVDRVARPHLEPYYNELIIADFSSEYATKRLIDIQPDVIIHCAASILVDESVKNPAEFYENNVSKTIGLLNNIVQFLPDSLVMFSSTGSVYEPSATLFESSFKNPVSPYSKSKYMVEQILESYNQAYDLSYCCFRYFNACGAMNDIHGQQPYASHIFAKLMQTVNYNEPFILNGSGFPTKDGTCVRDYIHVQDIVNAHVMAIMKQVTGTYNLGCGFGYSNLDCIQVVSEYYDKIIPISVGPHRAGDVATLVSDASRADTVFGWKTNHDIKDIVKSLDLWYNSPTFRHYKGQQDEQVGYRQAV